MKLIDKDKVVEEIEKRLDKMYNLLPDASKVENDIVTIPEACNTGKYMALESFREFLDTLEVKEVDLDNELDFVKDAYYYFTSDERSSMMKVARHFYELGLKVKKGE